jgi:hypothetical protein
MKRWLRSLIYSHAIGEAIASARSCSASAKVNKAQSSHEFDAWAESAFKHRQRRRYWMDVARSMVR